MKLKIEQLRSNDRKSIEVPSFRGTLMRNMAGTPISNVYPIPKNKKGTTLQFLVCFTTDGVETTARVSAPERVHNFSQLTDEIIDRNIIALVDRLRERWDGSLPAGTMDCFTIEIH